MQIKVEYHAQVKSAAGIAAEEIAIAPSSDVSAVLSQLAQTHGEALRSMLFTSDGRPHPAILLFVGDEQARPDRSLREGDVLTIMSPVAGG